MAWRPNQNLFCPWEVFGLRDSSFQSCNQRSNGHGKDIKDKALGSLVKTLQRKRNLPCPNALLGSQFVGSRMRTFIQCTCMQVHHMHMHMHREFPTVALCWGWQIKMSSSEDKSLISTVASGVGRFGKDIANAVTNFGRNYNLIEQFQVDRVGPEVCLQCHGSVRHGDRFCSQSCCMRYWREFQEYSHRTSGSIPTKLVPPSNK